MLRNLCKEVIEHERIKTSEAKAKADFAMIGDQRTNELYNGRLAMLAITGFAIQEGLWGSPVISQTPGFFGR